MVSELVLQIALILTIQTAFLVWIFRAGVKMLDYALGDLDTSIATALKQLVEQGFGDFEPQNPILAAIASRMMAQPGPEPIEVSRSNDGRFSQR